MAASPGRSTRPPKVWDEPDEGTATDQTAVIAPKSVRSQRHATLMALAGSQSGMVFRLDRDRVTIGRSKGADIVVASEGVSRVHCIITRDAKAQFTIEDHGSTNGTIVNGHTVTSAVLEPGDRIQVGAEAVFQFGLFDEAEEELATRMYDGATRDPLTRALNRRAFFERFQAELSYAVRHSAKLVVVLFDIDHFKAINDTYGHAGGDSVLRELGSEFAKLLRNEDLFARYGGEEFAVVARGLSLRQGVKLADRIRSAIEARGFEFDKQRFRVTVSAGVAELAEAKSARVAEEMLMLADSRLYKAKAAGRNRVLAK